VIKWLRYVPHRLVAEFSARGWRLADDFAGTHHGAHAVLMVWEGEHEPQPVS
jgi:hypothetical protein